uniref:Uncharacterized protein n=1 Tax=Lygus hesperus TaxID=30085 RepID=A0A146KVJ9_LYGHE
MPSASVGMNGNVICSSSSLLLTPITEVENNVTAHRLRITSDEPACFVHNTTSNSNSPANATTQIVQKVLTTNVKKQPSLPVTLTNHIEQNSISITKNQVNCGGENKASNFVVSCANDID